jgi:hypothetical protein
MSGASSGEQQTGDAVPFVEPFQLWLNFSNGKYKPGARHARFSSF